jgi:hypothetical protein
MSTFTREPEVSVFRKWDADLDTFGCRPWAILHKADSFEGRETKAFATWEEAVAFAQDLIQTLADDHWGDLAPAQEAEPAPGTNEWDQKYKWGDDE